MNQPSFILPALLALALAACQQPANDTDIAIDNQVNAAEAAKAEIAILPPSEEAGFPNLINGLNEADDAGSELPSPPNTPEQRMIPDQYRGRWGMVAADCDQRRGDAKGAIAIADRSIRFYESTATLTERRPAIATSFSGLFNFTGEGQTWSKVMTFTRTGNTLKRAESVGNYTYTRC